MANNLPGLNAAIVAAFTANLDATTRTKLLNRFVAAFSGEWSTRVASGTADNAANRAVFVADKVLGYVNSIYETQDLKEKTEAIATVEKIV